MIIFSMRVWCKCVSCQIRQKIPSVDYRSVGRMDKMDIWERTDRLDGAETEDRLNKLSGQIRWKRLDLCEQNLQSAQSGQIGQITQSGQLRGNWEKLDKSDNRQITQIWLSGQTEHSGHIRETEQIRQSGQIRQIKQVGQRGQCSRLRAYIWKSGQIR